MVNRIASLGITTILAGSMGACAPQSPVEPAITAQQAAAYLRQTGVQTATGTGFAGARNSTLKRLMGALDMVRGDIGDALPSPLPSPLIGVLGESTFVKTLLDPKSQADLGANLNDVSIHLERWVRDRLLAQQNLVNKTDVDALYLLKADPTCRPLAAPGAPLPAVDADCAAELEKIQVRVYMKAILDGVSLRFVVGPKELEFSTIVVRLDGLEWRADLGKAHAAKNFVDAALATEEDKKDPSETSFSKLTGKTVLAVKKDGPSGVTVTVSVTEAIEMERTKGKAVTSIMKTAAGMLPVFVVTGDGSTKIMSLQIELGATEFLSAWDPLGTGVNNTDHRVAFDGLSARGRLDEKQKELKLTEVGLTGYHEQVRGKTTMTMAVNPQAGGKFDVTANVDANNDAHFQFGTAMELVADYKMASLAPDFTGATKPYLPEETFKMVLAGPAKLSVITQRGIFAGLKVGAGSFQLSSTKAPADVKAATGACLTRAKTLAPTAHPLLGLLAVVPCP